MSNEKGIQLAKSEKKDVLIGGHPLSSIIDKQLWKSDELSRVANVIFPVTALDSLPPMYKPSLSVIRVNTDLAAKDIYPVGGGQYGLSKRVIRQMVNAYGAQVITKKLTPDSDLDYIRYTAMVFGRLPDGTPYSCQESKAWSWEKCQKEMAAGQAANYRKFADEQTESKAILRAARGFLAIKTSYTLEELKKPFLIARSVFTPDLSDPDVKRMYIQQQMGASSVMYSEPTTFQRPVLATPPAEPEDAEFEDDSDEPVNADSGTFSHKQKTPEPEQEATDEPTADEQANISKREIIDAIREHLSAYNVETADLANIIREIKGLSKNSSVPQLNLLSVEELQAVVEKLGAA